MLRLQRGVRVVDLEEGEAIIFSASSDEFFWTNESGAFVLRLLGMSGYDSASALAAALAAHFDVPLDGAEEDVRHLLSALQLAGLLVNKGGGES